MFQKGHQKKRVLSEHREPPAHNMRFRANAAGKEDSDAIDGVKVVVFGYQFWKGISSKEKFLKFINLT